jgi:hypothetical protein
MATKGNTIPERVSRWKLMTGSLTPLLPEMPYLTEMHTELEATATQLQDLELRHEALKAETREINRLRGELARTGDNLRSRLGAALKTRHGFTSEKLIEFGLQPRRNRGRDTKPRLRRPDSGSTAPAPDKPGGSSENAA